MLVKGYQVIENKQTGAHTLYAAWPDGLMRKCSVPHWSARFHSPERVWTITLLPLPLNAEYIGEYEAPQLTAG